MKVDPDHVQRRLKQVRTRVRVPKGFAVASALRSFAEEGPTAAESAAKDAKFGKDGRSA